MRYVLRGIYDFPLILINVENIQIFASYTIARLIFPSGNQSF